VEEHSHHPVSDVPKAQRKAWPVKRVLLSLILTAVFFAAGVAVGRGDIHLQGLSKSLPTAGPTTLDYSSVDQVYAILKKDYDGTLSNAALTDGLKSGLVSAAGDPYTEYFSPKDAKAFNDQLAGSITGIGAELGSDNNNIVVVSPLAGYPADKAGLKPKDIIAAIDGKSTVGMTISAVVQKIRGQEGTNVTLTLIRGSATPFQVTITRQKITVPSVKWQEDGTIGYMKINQFTDDTVGLAQKAAQEFKDKGVKGVVLDLRGNPGGYLTGAVNVSSLWLDEGKTVVQEKRGGVIVATDSHRQQHLKRVADDCLDRRGQRQCQRNYGRCSQRQRRCHPSRSKKFR